MTPTTTKSDPTTVPGKPLCHRCPLQGRHFPVQTEWKNSDTTVLAAFPGPAEVETGSPQSSGGGMLLTKTLEVVGAHRTEVNIANVLCCQPPDRNWDRMLRDHKKRNVEAGLEPGDMDPTNPNYILSPVEACRPRLLAELNATDNVIALGEAGRAGVHSWPDLRDPFRSRDD